jgi:hypothetical protein
LEIQDAEQDWYEMCSPRKEDRNGLYIEPEISYPTFPSPSLKLGAQL